MAVYCKEVLDSDPELLTVRIPKIEMECTYDLTEILEDKDFSFRIIEPFYNFRDNIDVESLSQYMLHKTHLSIDEIGTEAAALSATALSMCLVPEPDAIKLFHVNHPYYFVIRENTTGTILFLGRVMNPGNL